MRIIAGKYKRTPIRTLEGDDVTRPTRDMVKEALFSTISIDEDTSFLDLFSGSGSIGLEAISRGAKTVVFNDSNRDAMRIIESNLQKVNERREVFRLDYEECIRKLDGRTFDYIYCDPPYRFDDHQKLFSLIEEHSLLNEDGVLIMEVRKDTDLAENYPGVYLYKEKRYGINKLLYYRKGDSK